ncbi:hypothetical protein [Streptomyces hokutonensis]|uniref:hypothetical protein n=1 Tax=Streptomyces hokutonensis TaxID=1306990 RepID=UPI0003AA6169|nr:hypothetical protein [Streptomyces hokutonensis]
MSVAVEAGIQVLPFWVPDGYAAPVERAAAAKAAAVYAGQCGARLALPRHAVTSESPWSLSPAHLRRAPTAARLVLPSPSSAAIAAAEAPRVRVVAACLRNNPCGRRLASPPMVMARPTVRWP